MQMETIRQSETMLESSKSPQLSSTDICYQPLNATIIGQLNVFVSWLLPAQNCNSWSMVLKAAGVITLYLLILMQHYWVRAMNNDYHIEHVYNTLIDKDMMQNLC